MQFFKFFLYFSQKEFNAPQEHINYYENVKVGIETELNEVLAQETRLHNRVLAEKKVR